MSAKQINYRLLIAVASVALVPGKSLIAQNDSAKTVNLAEVVVSATRNDKHINDVARNVTVITEKDIGEGVYSSVAEVLAQYEGIYVVGAGQTPGALQGIYLRGANNNQAVLMIDGVRITDPSSADNAIDLSELSLANIEKIEIVRGGHSTLYGSSAIGGVINIITKKQGKKNGVNIDAGVRAGMFGSGTSDFREHVRLNYTGAKGFYINAEVLNNHVQGLDATVDTIAAAGVFKNRDKDNFSNITLTGKAGYRNDKTDAYASWQQISQQKDIDDGAYDDDENYTIDFNRRLLTYGFSHRLSDKVKLSYTGGMTEMTRTAIDDSSLVDQAGTTDHSWFEGVYEGKDVINEVQANIYLPHVNVVAGAGMYDQEMTFKTTYLNTAWVYESSSDLDTLDIGADVKSVFISFDIDGGLFHDKWNKLSLIAGGRLNIHSTYGSNLTYEIAPSYKVTKDAMVYASVSTGFNAPSLYRLFSPDKDFMSGITRGNENLQPETSVSYEIGVKQQVSKNTRIGISYYHTETENLIDYVYLWEKSTPVGALGFSDYRGDTYVNVGKQTNRGIEFYFSSALSNRLTLYGNFSLTSGMVEYSPDNIDTTHTAGHHVQLYTSGAFPGKDAATINLVRRPHTARASLAYKASEKLTLRSDLRHVGARNDIYYESSLGPYGALAFNPVADYTLIDMTASYRFSKHLSASVRIENAMDISYSEIHGYRTRGRGVYLRIGYIY